jgi:hypothetical protein
MPSPSLRTRRSPVHSRARGRARNGGVQSSAVVARHLCMARSAIPRRPLPHPAASGGGGRGWAANRSVVSSGRNGATLPASGARQRCRTAPPARTRASQGRPRSRAPARFHRLGKWRLNYTASCNTDRTDGWQFIPFTKRASVNRTAGSQSGDSESPGPWGNRTSTVRREKNGCSFHKRRAAARDRKLSELGSGHGF